MDKCFVLITQLRNLTHGRVGFRFDSNGNRFQLPVLPPGKTRQLKLSRMMRWLRRHEVPEFLKIRVTVDDEFTGIELDPMDLIENTRIVFRYERNVLCVDGVKENCSDFFFRIKYLGWMRNMVWDSRASTELKRSDSKLATKLREIEGVDGQHLAPSADTNLLKRQSESPVRKSGDKYHEEKVTPTKINNNNSTPALEPKIPTPPPPPPPPPINSVDWDAEDMTSTTTHLSTHQHDAGGGGVATKRTPADHEGGNRMDSFVHVFLFLVALAFLSFVGLR